MEVTGPADGPPSAAPTPGRPRRRLSRERISRGLFVLPTLFTVGNLFCGYWSIWSSIRGTFERSAVLIVLAAVLDLLDGRIARMTHSTSEFGEEYDSLADLVSFGVAPAVLVYSWGLADFERLGWVASFLFVVCGSMRLARFNIQTHVADKKYFVGLPIPAAAGTISVLVLATPEPLVDRVFMGDPVPLLQGPRSEAAAAGVDPPGDRALLRARRVEARHRPRRDGRRVRLVRPDRKGRRGFQTQDAGVSR